jgi:hypothetical protein
LATFDARRPAPGALEARERFVAGARELYVEALRAGLLASAGYFAFPLVAGVAAGNYEPGLQFGLVLGGLWAGATLLRHVFYRKQFRPADNRFGLTPAKLIVWVWMLRGLLAPRFQVPFIVLYLVLVAGIGFDGLGGGMWEGKETFRAVGGGLVAAAAVQVWLFIRLLGKAKQSAGVRLLVLRVFGIDANASFTFGRLARFWRHFGPYFTIVDPVFWRHKNRVFSLGTLGFLVGMFVLTVVIASPLEPHVSDDVFFVAVFFAYCVCLAGYIFVNEVRMRREFVRDEKHLGSILARLARWPRALDQSFRPLAALCYDNTWKLTVAKFTDIADVVLMDLRGFSNERKGCEFEVDYLFDHVPAERIVFLVSNTADLGLTNLLIQERWRLLLRSSPNLGLVNPEVKVYVSQSQDEHDVQGILDLLMLAASGKRPFTRAAAS